MLLLATLWYIHTLISVAVVNFKNPVNNLNQGALLKVLKAIDRIDIIFRQNELNEK